MPPVWTPNVRVVVDGDPVAASTDNGPISDLTNRTDWLKAQLDAFSAGTQLVLPNQAVQAGMPLGTPVYLDTATNTFLPAKASVDGTTLLAGDSTFWQGVLVDISGTVGSILLAGVFQQSEVAWNAVFDSGVFVAGGVFLSGVTDGKITTDPTTTAVYLGQMRTGGELLVRATSPNAFLDHVHYQRTLVGAPAGTVIDPAFNAVQTISVPNPAVQGWLPATPVYFPGFVVGVQIPTGAVFGYNIQQASESALREIFPMIPVDNAEFSQGGVILDDTRVVTNSYGIWWMTDAYGTAPWPVDYAATLSALDLKLWTTRIVAQQTTIDLLLGVLLSYLEAGAIDTVAVAGILSAVPADLLVTGTEGDGTNGYKGQVTLTNLGVVALKTGRGLTTTATAGTPAAGYRGTVSTDVNIGLEATHLWTELTAVGDKLALLTTNGVSSGTTLAARGHRLGSNAADFIDFVIVGGNDLLTGVNYQPTLTLKACVDTISGVPVLKDIEVDTYLLQDGQPVSSAALLRMDTAKFQTGVPGQLQTYAVGPFVNLLMQRNTRLLVRVKNTTISANPLNVDTLRLLSLSFTLTPV